MRSGSAGVRLISLYPEKAENGIFSLAGEFVAFTQEDDLFVALADGTIKQIPDVGGLLLGAMKNVEYQSNVIMLKPEESLFFHTDGVTEAFNKDDEEYKEARLEKVLNGKHKLNMNDLISHVFEDVQSFTNGVEQSDDITCVALKYCKQ